MSEATMRSLPRRGRAWVILALALGLIALGYSLVDLATRPAGPSRVQVSGAANAQETFGGIRQAGDRLGNAAAPVSVQVFADLQCGSCRASFLEAIPPVVEDVVRPGTAKLLLRHYSVGPSKLEAGFFPAEAAARQGYGWQYTYLFFANQDEARRFGIDSDFLASLAGAIDELNVPEWQAYMNRAGGAGGPIAKRLEGYERLGTELGIRTDVAFVVSGPHGARTLQDGPSAAAVEQAIEAVR